jgi:hypothetical protein
MICLGSAHEMAGTWALNVLGAPTLWLSMMSSAAMLQFFLFTLPAAALACHDPGGETLHN